MGGEGDGEKVTNAVVEAGCFEEGFCLGITNTIDGDMIELFLHIGRGGEGFDSLLHGIQLVIDTGRDIDDEDGEGANRGEAGQLRVGDRIAIVGEREGLLVKSEGLTLGIAAINLESDGREVGGVIAGDEELASGALGVGRGGRNKESEEKGAE